MKKIVLLIIAIFVSYIATYAGNEKSIRSMISQQIKVPAQLKNQKLNEKVNVEFKLENGKALVVHVETSNAELKKYIIEQFNSMSFSEIPENKELSYFININFRVL
jgi:hypothetical protein